MLDIQKTGPAPIHDDSGMFERAPVSPWVEDFSAVKRLLDGARIC